MSLVGLRVKLSEAIEKKCILKLMEQFSNEWKLSIFFKLVEVFLECRRCDVLSYKKRRKEGRNSLHHML